MQDNEQEGQLNIARFLETFRGPLVPDSSSAMHPMQSTTDITQNVQYTRSFEKLEEKIEELEEKFAISSAQNEAVLEELARTRKAVENQKGKDAFLAGLATSIANLKESVEALSQARNNAVLYNPAPTPERAFDAPVFGEGGLGAAVQKELLEKEQIKAALAATRAEKQKVLSSLDQERQTKQLAQAGWQAALEEKEKIVSLWRQEHASHLTKFNALSSETTEKNRIIASLHQKASQLKAVNVALNREIKRVHQERTDALRKSAAQAKEILSLRDALTAAEERFKSFNFEDRIISIKRQYEQKVNHLETQLQQVSATCMKQVEEIESLKTENIQLHKLAEEREQLAVLYDQKTKELQVLKHSVQQLRAEVDKTSAPRLAAFTQRMNHLQEEHRALSERLAQTQEALQNVTQEKETLEQNFKSLRKKMAENDSVIASLKNQIAVLNQENEVLKKKPAAAKPASEPVGVAVAAVKPKQHIHAKAAAEQAPAAPAKPVELQEAVHNNAIETSDDLPEIRVAEPMPKEELYGGEDFLERTDSFIGRMKWSIFREDK